MTKPREIMGIDFETASHCDIKLGSSAYAEHPTTRAMCAVFVIARHKNIDPADGECDVEYLSVEWSPGRELPPSVVKWIEEGGAILAHNVSFEHEIIKAGHIPGLPVPKLEQWHDTAAIAASLNLPQGLDALTNTLGLATVKDKDGYRVMMKCCKLDAEGKHVNKITDEDLSLLLDYCKTDVISMIEAFAAMPGMTQPERDTYEADLRLNEGGVHIDVEFTGQLADMAAMRQRRLNAESIAASAGLMTDAKHRELRRVLQTQGVELPVRARANGKLTVSMDAEACDELLKQPDMDSDVRQFIERKQEAGKLTSLSKLKTLPKMQSKDNRLRWQLRFCGASQTGRWSAKGLQLHNTPKDRRGPSHTSLVRALVAACDMKTLQAVESNVLESLSLCLRSMIIASPGMELVAADYSAIEARVLPWLCFFEPKLQLFRQGIDTYVKAAADIGSTNRNLGKVQELALGFGMGVPKFADTAGKWGTPLELKEARRVQKLWRENNAPIQDFWRDLDFTAKDIIQGKPGRAAPVGRCTLRRVTDRLVIELPSGRHLNYWGPKVERTVRKFDYVTEEGEIESEETDMEVIRFYGPKGRSMVLKETYGGKLCENVTQAVARDLLAHALVLVDRHPLYSPVIHMHDSLAALAPKGRGSAAEFEGLMVETPTWAQGLPVNAEGYVGHYYKG